MKRFITLDENKVIVGIRMAGSILDGEIESEIGNIGQIMQKDGTFITPEPEPTAPQTTLEDKINYIYYKSMGVIA